MVLGQAALEEGAGVDARARRGPGSRSGRPAPSSRPRKKWLKPTSYRLAALAYVDRWPPMPSYFVFARSTMASAFQRIMRRMRSSIASSPGKYGSCSGLIVLM